MTTDVAPTVLDVARSVARLDEHAGVQGVVNIDGVQWTRDDLRRSTAGMIGYHLHRAGLRRDVTRREVDVALIVSGASPFTVDQHALAITKLINAGAR